MTTPTSFLDHERAAWTPPADLRPSQWAEQFRELPRGQSPRPGMWRNANAPYLRLFMDLATAPGVQQINVIKGAQGGVSEAARNVIGFIAHQDPEPIGLALPSKDKGRKIVANRILPLFDLPAFRSIRTDRSADRQAEQVRLLNGFMLHLMWAGSATAMASDPMRLVINDEVDKFGRWTGREADPVSLTWKRLRAYGDRGLQINISTPTDRFGQIYQLYDASTVKLTYQFECPDCGHWQPYIFDQLKWSTDYPADDYPTLTRHAGLAAHLEATGAVWYECRACGLALNDDTRAEVNACGQWRTRDGAPIVDAYGEAHANAETVTHWPRGTRIGLHVNALAYLWASWSSIAAEFLRAQNNLAAMYDFRTETLGEPWEQMSRSADASVYAGKQRRATVPMGYVPPWAVKLLMSVDTQHDHFYAVVRAWGGDMRSQRVWHGQLQTFSDIDAQITHPWPVAADNRVPMTVDMVAIDTGGTQVEGDDASRTMAVYRWAMRRRAIVRPIKGRSDARDGVLIKPGTGLLRSGNSNRGSRRKLEIPIWMLDTQRLQDMLADLIHRGLDLDGALDPEDDEIWLLNQENPDDLHAEEDYREHMSNVIKIMERDGNSMVERWQPKIGSARVDYWDCEVYQVALAHMANVHLLPSHVELERARVERQTQRKSRKAKPRARDKWAPSRFKI